MKDSKILNRAPEIIKENPEMFEALVKFEKTGRLPTIEELKKRKQELKKQ